MSSSHKISAAQDPEYIEIEGARVHNLKNVDIKIPRNKLVVITGLSGSGKSSLAFDTIFAEGQRRYIESFSAYARQFLGSLKKPDVESINGLSPVISIEQKTTGRTARSTVGTITEIYDFLRLLYARVGTAYSYKSGLKMERFSQKQILEELLKNYDDKKIVLLAPLVKGRKGHYRELFEKLAKQGFSKVYVDGELMEIVPDMQLDRFKIHDISLVIDRLEVGEKQRVRLRESLQEASLKGGGNTQVLSEDGSLKLFSEHLSCPETGLSYDVPEPNTFSFNSPYGACPSCKGIGVSHSFDEKKLIPNKSLSIAKGAIPILGTKKNNYIFNKLEAIAEENGTSLKVPFKDYSDSFKDLLFFGDKDPEVLHPFEGIFQFLKMQSEFSAGGYRKVQRYLKEDKCTSCDGYRLKKESLHFKIGEYHIGQLCEMDIAELALWLENVDQYLDEDQKLIAGEILKEVKEKVSFLLNVGLYYLTLNRTAKTLSGGESQRIRLASQIGAQLVGVLYILDEPSIGLHPNDNTQLIAALKKLRDHGNSVIVVEHDREIMEESDHIIDIGPRAGINGGEISDQGSFKELSATDSFTYRYLKGDLNIDPPKKFRKGNGNFLEIKKASGNNLKNVNLKLPLGSFIGVTGVSGSGKSSLIKGTLSPILFNAIYKSGKVPLVHEGVAGIEHIDKVIEIDQSPIGRTPRSNPATYTGLFGDIRKLFAELPQSKVLGYKPGRFSFNVAGGRCETCKGGGMQLIEMNFLPDVYVVCKDCNGKRYNKEILKIKYKGKNISEVLDMDFGEAESFFSAHPAMKRKIAAINQVGLSYVKLGQSSTTLSGGEAQRIKLASELQKKDTGQTFYILDEPTTGLHFEDIRMLLEVLQKIVDKGNTVLVVEHNLDVIKCVDYIVDLGPKGGKDGGKIVAKGTPTQLTNSKSLTGKYLKKELENGGKD